MKRRNVPALALAAALLAPGALAQQPRFEVASVKRNTSSNGFDVTPRRSGDLVIMHNTQLYSMIVYAYHIHANYEVAGYKGFEDPWRWYDVDARIGRDATDEEVRLMMQSLLADRFRLQVHRETREMPLSKLTVAKGKPKLPAPAEGETLTVTIEGRPVPARSGTCGASLWNDGTHVICHAAGIDKLIPPLIGELQAPVTDHTGLSGTYDLQIQYVPERRKMDEETQLGPSLAEALQAELGLKLEKSKGPVEVLVIDRMEKPSEN